MNEYISIALFIYFWFNALIYISIYAYDEMYGRIQQKEDHGSPDNAVGKIIDLGHMLMFKKSKGYEFIRAFLFGIPIIVYEIIQPKLRHKSQSNNEQ